MRANIMSLGPYALLAAALLLGTPDPAAPRFHDFFQPVQPPRPFQLIAHRGAMFQAPENTRAALEHVILDEFEWAEIDVRLTADGRHVVWHDPRVDGKSDGEGAVREMTGAQLLALDVGAWFAPRFAGERMLTLSDAFEIARNRLNLYLDCKDVNPALLAREIAQAGMERQVVVYGSPTFTRELRRLSDGAIPIMTKWRPHFGVDEWLGDSPPEAVEIDAGDVTPEVVRAFHAAGVWVQAKVLNEVDRPEVWARMIDAGVDWLQTDYPEEVVAQCVWKRIPNRPVGLAMHRGAGRYAPENTMPAFRKAVRMAADYVEFDVRTTADGTAVLLHDRNLDRTTDGAGPVSEKTRAEIAALDAGSWFGRPHAGEPVPAFDAFLGAIADEPVELYLDAKDIGPQALSEALVRHGLVERAVVYQSPAYLAELRQVNPAIRRMPPLRDASSIDEIARQVAPYAFDTAWSALSADLIAECHRRGIRVYSDAIGPHETVDHYLQAMEWGIDVIQTDFPVRVMRAVEIWTRKAATPDAPAAPGRDGSSP